MRSEKEVEGLANELLKIVDDSPENYRNGVYETCVHYVACLLWVMEEFDTAEVVRGFLFRKTAAD